MSRRSVIIFLLSVLAVLSASAEGRRLLPPGGCIAIGDAAFPRAVATRASSPAIGDICIPIILAAYRDVPFTVPNVQQVWHDIANKPGYAEHGARGSMADYFLEQSRGLFRVTFDVLGPVTLPEKREYYGKNSGSGSGTDVKVNNMIRDACLQVLAGGADFSRYDWNGDGSIETVLVIYSGPGENVRNAPTEYVWPKMGYAPYQVGSHYLSLYACSNETVWPDMTQDGFGTLLHEFSHCLGLPDLYNVSPSVDDYIVFDEWDLMDGGCYADNSWRPVGYSAYERYLCGWLEPEELSQQTTIDGLKPLTDGGKAYLIRNDAKPDEFFMLENRQWQSFDDALPGHGLLVTHISDHGSSLSPNNGSTVKIYPIAADNRTYVDCLRDYVKQYYHETLPNDVFELPAVYKDSVDDAFGRIRLMTRLAYPYVEEGIILNDRLTDDSTPAAVTLSPNASGLYLLSRPITDIREADGLVSFRFMDSESAISETMINTPPSTGVFPSYFDLLGRRLTNPAPGTLCIARYADGTIKKIVR